MMIVEIAEKSGILREILYNKCNDKTEIKVFEILQIVTQAVYKFGIEIVYMNMRYFLFSM